MKPNILIIPVIGVKKCGITQALETAKSFMTGRGCLRVKVVQDEEDLLPDPFLGDLTLMQESHPEFGLMATIVKMARVVRMAKEVAEKAEDNTILLCENSGAIIHGHNTAYKH